MKKYTNILVALGVTLFLLTVGMKDEVIAVDCKCLPIIDTLTVDGCDYEVEVCALCRYSYPGEASIQSITNLGPCSTTLNSAQVVQGIMSQISTYAYLWFDHCQKNVAPCNSIDRTEITFDIPICWHVILIFFDGGNPQNNIYLYEQCDDEASCKVTYSYCKDAFGTVHKEVVGYDSYGIPSCTLEGEYVQLPLLGIESECYIIHTPCNP